MFERFTERARRVVVAAQEEARLLGHNHIGSEHLLLGLLHEQASIARRVLDAAGITLEAVRRKKAGRIPIANLTAAMGLDFRGVERGDVGDAAASGADALPERFPAGADASDGPEASDDDTAPHCSRCALKEAVPARKVLFSLPENAKEYPP